MATELARIFSDHDAANYGTKVRSVRSLSSDTGLLYAVAGMVPPGGTEIVAEQNAVKTVVAHHSDED